jgi:hypothetical protein
MQHDPACRWERAECEYKATHYYCPHPEHACNCQAPAERVPSDLTTRLRSLVDACVVPEFKAKLAATLAELEAWERAADNRH